MHWNEFLDTADRLAQGAKEGDWRSAISRGYYAVFHHFRAFLLAHGLNVGYGAQSHVNIYGGLNNCGFAAMSAVAQRLDRLRSRRVESDYDSRRVIRQWLARDIVQESRALIGDFQNLLATVPAAQVVDGARQYLQSIGRLGPAPP